jgi:hypothetical protein
MVVDLPDTDPFGLVQPIDDAPSAPQIAAEVARVTAEHAVPALATAFERAVTSFTMRPIEPGSTAAALALAAVARSVLLRLRVRDGRACVELTQVEATHVDLLGLPLLRARSGRALTMRDIAQRMNACHGLVYGTIASVPAALDGLDLDRILDLDEASERLLVTLVGEGCYVRIDRRDVLAQIRDLACRDLALGLRAFPEFAVLVEGADPTDLPADAQRACTKALVVRLARRFLGLEPVPPQDAHARDAWEECRRQACRQLQWFIARTNPPADAPRDHDEPDFGVADLPLFLDAGGQPRSWREVRSALDQPQGLTLLYGHACGAAELGHLAAAALKRDPPPQRPPPNALLADAWVHRLLANHGNVHLAFDFDLQATDGDDTTAFVAEAAVQGPGFRGRIGVPARPIDAPDIPLVLPDKGRARVFSELALTHGVVGWVRLDEGVAWSDDKWVEVAHAIQAAAEQTLGAVVDTLPSVTDVDGRAHRIDLLLRYAARHVVLQMDPHGRAHANVVGSFVTRVLSMPLFASSWGGMWSGWRLVRRFCGLLQTGIDDPAAVILSELQPPIDDVRRRWIEQVLCPGNVARAPAHDIEPEPTVPAASPALDADQPALCRTVEYWLSRLRPDDVDPSTRVWLMPRGDTELVEGAIGALYLNSEHWLCAWAQRSAVAEPQVLAWLLLGVYAHLNAVLDPVLNTHERVFQSRVLDALSAGHLRMIEATPAST